MLSRMLFSRPTIIVPPLAMEVKLAAVNAMLDKKKKRHAKHMSSTAHVVLTPGFPVYHQNYVSAHGLWDPLNRAFRFTSPGQDFLTLSFPTVAQATYLLDVTVGWGFGDWQYQLTQTEQLLPLTNQAGHLLYPFLGDPSGDFWMQLISPQRYYGQPYWWHRVELTKVD